MEMTERYCKRCEGSGSIPTGLSELSESSCLACEGTGYERATPADHSDDALEGPEYEDGPTEDGFHQCTPYNGGHSWCMPYQEHMEWIIRCNKCGLKDPAPTDKTFKPTADTPYVEVDGVTYVVRWHENKSSYVVQTKTPEQIASRMMVAARNAQMFQDIRSIVATCADLKARAPYRHIEAQRVLPLLDSFLGEGFTGRVIEFKRMLEAQPPQPEVQSVQQLRALRVELANFISDPMWDAHAEVPKRALKRWHNTVDTYLKENS